MVSRWSYVCLSILLYFCPCFLFPYYIFIKYQWIFTKLDMCIDIVEIWFGIANGQILSTFDRVICQLLTELSARHMIVAGYYHFTFLILKVFSFDESSCICLLCYILSLALDAILMVLFSHQRECRRHGFTVIYTLVTLHP